MQISNNWAGYILPNQIERVTHESTFRLAAELFKHLSFLVYTQHCSLPLIITTLSVQARARKCSAVWAQRLLIEVPLHDSFPRRTIELGHHLTYS
ncbi:hypothetical protein TNCV_1952861 [Trichonephila clavipes]|nr:hypothetical protein TNCV_1952861 [Trichonephila clavipes]